VLLCVLADRSLTFAWRLRPITGLIAVLLACGAWYAAAAARGGRAFVTIVVNENLVRAVGESHFALGHRHSVGYLIGSLAAGLLPWTVLLPSVAVALWRARRTLDRWDPRLFSSLWLLAVFAPFAVAPSKRSVYLLPLYPALALLLGWWARELVRGGLQVRWLHAGLAAVAWVLAAALGLLAVLAGAQAVGLPLLDSVTPFFGGRTAFDIAGVAAAIPHHPGFVYALVIASAAAVAMGVGAGLRRWGTALVAMFACTAAVVIAVRAAILPAIAEAYTRRTFAAGLGRVVGDRSALYTVEALDYGTLFYWGEAVPTYDPERAETVAPFLLLPEYQWIHMSPGERGRYRRVPGLSIERNNDQGYVSVVQHVDEVGGG